MYAYKRIYHFLQINYHFSDTEIAKFKYTIEVLFYELSKVLFFLLFFGITHKLADFAVCFFILLPFRSFSGGLHFKRYISCFLFSVLYFSALIFLLCEIPVAPVYKAILLILCSIILFVTGPVPSKKRPVMDLRQYRIFRGITISFALVYSFLILFVDDLPYKNLMFWSVVLHTLQISCARIARKGDTIHEKT